MSESSFKGIVYAPGVLNRHLWTKGTSSSPRSPGLMRRGEQRLLNRGSLESTLAQTREMVDGMLSGHGIWNPAHSGPFYAQVLAWYEGAGEEGEAGSMFQDGLISFNREDLAQGKVPLASIVEKLSADFESIVVPAVYCRIPELDVARAIPQEGADGTPALGPAGDWGAIRQHRLFVANPNVDIELPPPGSIVKVDFIDKDPTDPFGQLISVEVVADFGDAFNYSNYATDNSAFDAFDQNDSSATTLAENADSQEGE